MSKPAPEPEPNPATTNPSTWPDNPVMSPADPRSPVYDTDHSAEHDVQLHANDPLLGADPEGKSGVQRAHENLGGSGESDAAARAPKQIDSSTLGTTSLTEADYLGGPSGEVPAELLEGEPAQPYEEWSVEELQGEIRGRNDQQDDPERHMMVSGKKDELVERLNEDDRRSLSA